MAKVAPCGERFRTLCQLESTISIATLQDCPKKVQDQDELAALILLAAEMRQCVFEGRQRLVSSTCYQ